MVRLTLCGILIWCAVLSHHTCVWCYLCRGPSGLRHLFWQPQLLHRVKSVQSISALSMNTMDEDSIDFDDFYPLSGRYDDNLQVLLDAVPMREKLRRLGTIMRSVWEVLTTVILLRDEKSRNTAICDELINLGPVFIKVGQSLSCRSDLCGENLAKELTRLTDRVPPSLNQQTCIDILEQDFGANAPINELSKPIASASIGQVHSAYIPDVGRVAIKIQRPDAVLDIIADMSLALSLVTFLQRLIGVDSRLAEDGNIPIFKSNGVIAVKELGARLLEELDYINEGENVEKFRQLYAEDGLVSKSLPKPGVVVPQLIKEYCSSRVLTMTWIDGTKLLEIQNKITDSNSNQEEGISAKEREDLKKLTVLGIECSLSQLLETGVLHADPHGGNLLKSGGKLVYLDFGLLAYVPQQVRDALMVSILHLIDRDFAALAREFDSLLLLDKVELAANLDKLETGLKTVADQILVYDKGNGESKSKMEDINIPRVNFNSIVEGLAPFAAQFEFKTPPYFLNNVRALVALEGFALTVDPEFSLFEVVYPFVVRRVLVDYGKRKKITQAFRRLVLDENNLLNIKKCKELLRTCSTLGIKQHELILTFLGQVKGWVFLTEMLMRSTISFFQRLVRIATPSFLQQGSNNVNVERYYKRY